MIEILPTPRLAGAPPVVEHVKRDFNHWVDALTQVPEDTRGFYPCRRHHVDLGDDTQWYIWHELKDKDNNILTQAARKTRASSTYPNGIYG